jgi:hypothetical protein
VYERVDAGWGWPAGAVRGHLFDRSTRSLCGRWDYAGGFVSEADVRPVDLAGHCCAACVRAGHARGLLPFTATQHVDADPTALGAVPAKR